MAVVVAGNPKYPATKWATKLWGRAVWWERRKVTSGVSELAVDVSTLARIVKNLVDQVEALVKSDIYQQRLARCLRRPRNAAPLEDFLLLDDFFRLGWPLAGSDGRREKLLKLREKAFEGATPDVARGSTRWRAEMYRLKAILWQRYDLAEEDGGRKAVHRRLFELQRSEL